MINAETCRSIIVIGIITATGLTYGTEDIFLTTDFIKGQSYCFSEKNFAMQFDGIDEVTSAVSSAYVSRRNIVELKSAEIQVKHANQSPGFDFIYDKRWERFPIKCSETFSWTIGPNQTNIVMSINAKTDLFITVPGYEFTIKLAANKNIWNHFSIDLKSHLLKWNNLTISMLSKYEVENVTIVRIDKEQNGISLEGDGTKFCIKIHDYAFLWLTSAHAIKEIGSINQPKGQFCLSAYVSACKSCSMHIRLSTHDTGLESLSEFEGQGKKWDEVKTTIFLPTAELVRIFVKAILNNPAQDAYWAIDIKARQCDTNELAYIKVDHTSANGCSRLKSPEIGIANIPDANSQLSICPNDKISSNLTFDYNSLRSSALSFNNIRVCSQYRTGGNKTQCCCIHSWGDKCRHSCNEIESVKVLQMNHTWAELLVTLTYKQKPDDLITVYIKEIQTWKKFCTTQNSTIQINNLTSGTDYQVELEFRSPINNINSFCIDTRVKSFTTSCTDISSEQLQIHVTNTTAVLQVKTVIPGQCPLEKYCEFSNIECKSYNNNTLQLSSLIPFKKYSIHLNNSITKGVLRADFKTLHGRPSSITNFYATVNNTYIHVKWSSPASLFGNFANYKLKIKSQNCMIDGDFERNIETTETETYITNLIPGVKYKLTIWATNDVEFHGAKFWREITTKDDYIFNQLDLPVNITATNETITITRKCPSRKSNFCLKIKCLNEWCKDDKILELACSESNIRYVSSLHHFSNYSVELLVVRGTSSHLINSTYYVITEATVPQDLKPTDINFYWKCDRGIHIQMPKADRPLGDLQNYQMKYQGLSKEFHVFNCQYLKDYNCIDIDNTFTPNTTYGFNISSKNFGTTYSNEVTKTTNTSEIKSAAPLSLSVDWVNETMLVRWSTCPNLINGLSQQFKIKLSYENTIVIKSITSNQVENKLIISDIKKCDVYYNVEVYAVDSNGEGAHITKQIFIPPVIQWAFWENDTDLYDDIKHSSVYVIGINKDIDEQNMTNSTVEQLLTYATNKVNNCTLISKMNELDVNEISKIHDYKKLLLVFVGKCDEVYLSQYHWYLLLGIPIFVIITYILIILHKKRKLKNRNLNDDRTIPLVENQPYFGDIQLADYGTVLKNLNIKKLEEWFNNLPIKEDESLGAFEYEEKDYGDTVQISYFGKDILVTQAPNHGSEEEFWRMACEESVILIIMVTSLRERDVFKGYKYWPDLSKTMKVSDSIVIECTHEIYKMDYVERKLQVTYNSISRRVEHVQYFAWNEDSLPTYIPSLLTIMEKIAAITNQKSIIHSGKDTGRTDILLLCDFIIEQKTYGALNFQTGLNIMRTCRRFALNDFGHFKLALVLIYEYTCRDTRKYEIVYDNHFLWQLDLHLQDNGIHKIFGVYQKLECCQKFIRPNANKKKKYNAVNCGSIIDKFIIMKSSPVVWDIVTEMRVDVIIKINGIILLGPNYKQKIISPDHQAFELYDRVFNGNTLKIYSFKQWHPGAREPNIEALVELCLQLLAHHDQEKRILVCSTNGLTPSYILVALYLVLLRMKLDKVCNVISVFQSLRMVDHDFQPTREHLELMYKLIRVYVRSIQNSLL